MEPFLQAVIKLQPCGEIAPGILKKGFQKIVFEFPKANVGSYDNNIWAGERQERLTTVLYHLRRLGREEERFRQVAAKLTPPELNVLKHLVDQLDLSVSSSVASGSGASGSATHDSSQPAITDESQDQSAPIAVAPVNAASGSSEVLDADELQVASPLSKRRKLAKMPSDFSVDSQGVPTMWGKSPNVSCDDHGVPTMWDSPAETKHYCPSPQMQKESAADLFDHRDEEFQQALSLPLVAGPKAKRKAKAKAKSEATSASAVQAQAKASAVQAQAVAVEPQGDKSKYESARANFSGSQVDWLASDEFQAVVASLKVSEIKRRRFERHRPDLFNLVDGKCILISDK
jgi:hypothetical protein